MTQVAMDGVAPFLPQEIVTDILKFLPVKSLIRFQCVCKHWKNLIKSPSFIDVHLHHSIQRRPCLLFQPYFIRNHMQLYSLDCEMQIVEVQNIPVVDGVVQIVGSSNGLLCLRIYGHGNGISPFPPLLLWNPAFREVRHVPTTFPDFEGVCYIGFGYSPIVNDYKIVRLHFSMNGYEADVFSLGIGSWKKIEVGNLEGLVSMSYASFTINGAIFWRAMKQDMGDGREYVIVSFDIAMEVFSLIQVPAPNLIYAVNVTQFEHRLAILSSNLIGNYESCLIELWTLEEATGGFGERWSWAKKYTSKPYPCFLHPISIWRNEIVCIFYQMDGDEGPEHVESTVISNFTTTELKVLFDHGHYIFNYVESLIPVSNIHFEES